MYNLLPEAMAITLFAIVFWIVGWIFSFFSKNSNEKNDEAEEQGEEDKEEKQGNKGEEKEFSPFLAIIVATMVTGVIIGLFYPIGLLIAALSILVAFIWSFLKKDTEEKGSNSAEENIPQKKKDDGKSDIKEKEISPSDGYNKYRIILFAIFALIIGVVMIGVFSERVSDKEPEVLPTKEFEKMPDFPVPSRNEEIKSENQSSESSQVRLITLGEGSKIKKDDIRWKITDVVDKKSNWGGESTNGKFLKINFRAENLSSDLKTVNIGDGKLIKNSRTSYDCFDYSSKKDSSLARYVQRKEARKETGRGKIDLKPSIPEDFYYVFEVPKDLEDFTIEFGYSLEE